MRHSSGMETPPQLESEPGEFGIAMTSSNTPPAIRILPMSDKIDGFRGLSIADVQSHIFLRKLPAMKGRFPYRSSGLKAASGTVVLFQFKARIVASAIFLRDEKFDCPIGDCNGAMFFDVKSFRTFKPLDVEAMRKIWPRFGSFGHVKQRLNPTLYRRFNRALQQVRTNAKRARDRRSSKPSRTAV